MNGRERETLLEAAATAYRERDVEGRVVPPPAWWDLPPEEREELFQRQLVDRIVERAAHPRGRTSTVMAVMLRIGG